MASSNHAIGAIDHPLPEQPSGAVGGVERMRAELYHFLELALAHPGEAGYDYFRRETSEQSFLAAYDLAVPPFADAEGKGRAAAVEFFRRLREMSYEQLEADYISLFANNYPHLPCPPYGSLFTAVDSEKRLEEMLGIKEFYQRHGMDIADSFDDLPDHICVELEFMQVLGFRESDAAGAGDGPLVIGLRATEAEFLDRYLLPFAARLAELANGTVPANPYSSLLAAARAILVAHRSELAAMPTNQDRSRS